MHLEYRYLLPIKSDAGRHPECDLLRKEMRLVKPWYRMSCEENAMVRPEKNILYFRSKFTAVKIMKMLQLKSPNGVHHVFCIRVLSLRLGSTWPGISGHQTTDEEV